MRHSVLLQVVLLRHFHFQPSAARIRYSWASFLLSAFAPMPCTAPHVSCLISPALPDVLPSLIPRHSPLSSTLLLRFGVVANMFYALRHSNPAPSSP
mmetsp:Transcript_35/g.93  ORF Transcript_35/g.93 Transcript_35/m.93 type:complete len:97 (-) Transcript_35:375-665(-)